MLDWSIRGLTLATQGQVKWLYCLSRKVCSWAGSGCAHVWGVLSEGPYLVLYSDTLTSLVYLIETLVSLMQILL